MLFLCGRGSSRKRRIDNSHAIHGGVNGKMKFIVPVGTIENAGDCSHVDHMISIVPSGLRENPLFSSEINLWAMIK